MKGFLQDIIIGVLIFVICLIIAIVTGANFLWLFLPLVIIVLLATLGNLLRQRYGSSYGITVYLFLFLVVPILWYLFCSQMPITAVTLKTQQKAEDFSSFKNYEGSIDAKQQFVEYQLRQDSIVKQEVSRLLNDGKVDSALALLKQSQSNTDKIRNQLFANSDVSQNNSNKTPEVQNNSLNNRTVVGSCMKNNATIYFYAEKPFNIIFSLDKGKAGYSTVSKPAGNSTQHFDNAGDIVVDEPNRNDIKIIKIKYD